MILEMKYPLRYILPTLYIPTTLVLYFLNIQFQHCPFGLYSLLSNGIKCLPEFLNLLINIPNVLIYFPRFIIIGHIIEPIITGAVVYFIIGGILELIFQKKKSTALSQF